MVSAPPDLAPPAARGLANHALLIDELIAREAGRIRPDQFRAAHHQAARPLSPEVLIAAPGTSCRHQIKDGTSRNALHPAAILHAALA